MAAVTVVDPDVLRCYESFSCSTFFKLLRVTLLLVSMLLLYQYYLKMLINDIHNLMTGLLADNTEIAVFK